MITESYAFFEQLKPSLRFRMVNECFSEFKGNFNMLWED